MHPTRSLLRQARFAGLTAITLLLLPIFSGCEDESPGATDPSTAPTRPASGVASGTAAGMAAGPEALAMTTTLPFAGGVNSAVTAWSIAQDGTGGAGRFWATPTSTGIAMEARNDGTGPAFIGWSTGTGNAGIFEVFNAQSSADVLRILNSGRGKGLTVTTSSTTNANTAVEINNAGTGRGLSITQQLSSNPSPALEVFSPGPGPGLLIQTGNAIAARFIGQGNGTNSVMAAVGIGTAPAVHGVASNLGTGTAATFESFNTTNSSPAVSVTTSGTGPVLSVNHTGSAGPLAIFRLNGVNQIRLTRFGRGFFNGGTQTGGADVAEAFEVEGSVEAYEPGDVLEISTASDRRVTRSSDAYSTLVIGVYATKPGVLLTELSIDDPMERMIPVGVIGVIPTKVTAENGAIRRGDLLVSAKTPGHVMRADPRRLQVGMVVGKALQEFSGPGSGLIRVLVNVK